MGALTFGRGRRPGLWMFVVMLMVGAAGCTINQFAPPAQTTGRPAPPTTAAAAAPTTASVQSVQTARTQPPTRKAPATMEPDPATVVADYFDAINAHDYEAAWRLGGASFGQSYREFVEGFADTEHDTVTILGVDGSIVTVRLVALQSGGRRSVYQGTYTVEHGRLTAATVHRLSGSAPTPQTPEDGACVPAYPDRCLQDGVGDYDCAGGSGNGPNYVEGPIRVLAPDPFGLDADGNGVGCES